MIAKAYERFAKIYHGLTMRPFNKDKDYFLARIWWAEINKTFLTPDILPEYGIVIEQEGNPICMTWLYVSNSKMGQIGWTVTEKGAGPKVKMAAVMMAIDEAVNIAKKLGLTALQTFSDSSALSKTFEGLGFLKMKPHDFFMMELGG